MNNGVKWIEKRKKRTAQVRRRSSWGGKVEMLGASVSKLTFIVDLRVARRPRGMVVPE